MPWLGLRSMGRVDFQYKAEGVRLVGADINSLLILREWEFGSIQMTLKRRRRRIRRLHNDFIQKA